MGDAPREGAYGLDLLRLAELGLEGLLLRDGQIVQTGRAEELIRAPVDPFVTRFVNAQRTALDRGPRAGGES